MRTASLPFCLLVLHLAGMAPCVRGAVDSPFLVISEQRFQLSSVRHSSGGGTESGGFFVLNEVKDLIPKVPKSEHPSSLFASDAQRAVATAKEHGESVEGLKRFFSKVLPKEQIVSFASTAYGMRMVLRCRNPDGKKVWVIHMNWEAFYEGRAAPVKLGHIVTFVVDYETGEIILRENCT